MLDFQLFRIRVIPGELHLFDDRPQSRSEILKRVVLSLSGTDAALKKDVVWHVGNIRTLNEDAVYLRIGKTTKSKLEVFQDGNFLDQEFETAPYTHVLLIFDLEICAIAKKSKLAPFATTIARHLRRLVNNCGKAKELEAGFEIDAINDPQDFIYYLYKAFAVSKFQVTFKRPNAWDVNKDFVKPLQKMLLDIGGEEGKTEIKGKELETDKLEELSRSVAATGDGAAAWLQMEEGVKEKVKKVLRDNPVYLRHEDLVDDETIHRLLERLKKRYSEIRGDGEDDR